MSKEDLKAEDMPDRIYLQWDDDYLGPHIDINDCSWCADRINENDVEYVRADRAPGWIACSERMPERAVPLWGGWFQHGGDVQGPFISRSRGLFADPSNYSREFTQPSHWMPLPPPPWQAAKLNHTTEREWNPERDGEVDPA